MSNEVYALALKSTLQEIQNACPDVTSNFIFKDGEIIAKTKNTEEETATQTINAFNDITERADVIGGLEAVTIQGAEGKINIAAMNDFYLTTVSSKEADEKYVNTLTRVLIPIVIKLVEEIQSASEENETITNYDEAPTTVEPEPVEDEVTEEIADEPAYEPADEVDEANDTENEQPEEPEEETAAPELYEEPEPVELEVYDDPLLPEPPVTQLMVENLGGLLVPSDTVRIGQEVIAQWKELYSDKKINEVEVEALNGKSTRCKFKQIKKSKDSGKGIIKMPEKIQLTLETASGELVTVKPIVE
jgi:hypothetical protein